MAFLSARNQKVKIISRAGVKKILRMLAIRKDNSAMLFVEILNSGCGCPKHLYSLVRGGFPDTLYDFGHTSVS